MLPDWKHVKYGLVLFISTVSLYDISEREVYSMALSENIKKYREEKNLTQQQLADKLYVRVQLDMSVPLWCTIGFLCVEIPLFIANFTISKKLREM